MPRPSTLQVRIVPASGKASVRFHHEKLPDREAREKMHEHWAGALDRLQELSRSRR